MLINLRGLKWRPTWTECRCVCRCVLYLEHCHHLILRVKLISAPFKAQDHVDKRTHSARKIVRMWCNIFSMRPSFRCPKEAFLCIALIMCWTSRLPLQTLQVMHWMWIQHNTTIPSLVPQHPVLLSLKGDILKAVGFLYPLTTIKKQLQSGFLSITMQRRLLFGLKRFSKCQNRGRDKNLLNVTLQGRCALKQKKQPSD